MKSVYSIFLLCVSLIGLNGCQVQYEPLITANLTLEERSLEGPMADFWNENLEPLIQDQCLQCHWKGEPLNTGLWFIASSENPINDNLTQALLYLQYNTRFELSENNHSSILEYQNSILINFESYASAYWQWQTEIERKKYRANTYFEHEIENLIIQPVCTGCHLKLSSSDSHFAGALSFYNYNTENHANLNSTQALNYLMYFGQPDLLFLKAIGRLNHGGISAISPNSIYADKLEQHALMIEHILQLSNTQPY